jgi:hypothetical protein
MKLENKISCQLLASPEPAILWYPSVSEQALSGISPHLMKYSTQSLELRYLHKKKIAKRM